MKWDEGKWRASVKGLNVVSNMGLTLSRLKLSHYFGFDGGEMEGFVEKYGRKV